MTQDAKTAKTLLLQGRRNTFGLVLAMVFVLGFIGFGLSLKAKSLASITCPGVTISPGTDIQTVLNANSTGVTFCIKAGTYRLTSALAPKAGTTIWGEKGAIINGSKLLTGWTPSGATWYVGGALPADYTDTNYKVCEDNVNNPCEKAERVFRNNTELTRVMSLAAVTAGTFYSDYATGRVYVGDDPNGNTLEVSSTRTAITSTAINVTIRNLIVEKFATFAQRGAVEPNGTGWVIQNNELRFNHGNGLKVQAGGAQVTANYIHHNGQTGMTVYNNQGTTVSGNELAYNNTDGFWVNDGENGGIKVAKTGMSITGNYVHDNHGLGIWVDIDNKDVTISNNYVANNDSSGIRYEISYNGIITGNTVVHNGFARGRGTNGYLGEGAAIDVNTSTNVQISGNTVYDNDKGIGLTKANRGSGLYGLWDLAQVTVSNNAITLKNSGQHGLIQYVSDLSYYTGKGNTFTGNTYHLSSLSTNRFQWSAGLTNAAGWRAAGNDTTGTVDTVYPAQPTAPVITAGQLNDVFTGSTPTPSPSSTPVPISADINRDGIVNAADLSTLLTKWGTNDTFADINHDGIANAVDLSILLTNWGVSASPTPTSTPVTIWHPAPGTSWQWQITGTVDASYNVAMYDIDLFDAQSTATAYTVSGFGTVNVPQGQNAGIIDRLHAAGRVVVCYLDTGAWENYRPDQALFPASVIGLTTGWSGEKWLDIRTTTWASFEPLIAARLDLAKRSNCDGVEPDQNNPLGNNPGFAITTADQKAWYLEVARLAHARGLSVGQKNGIETTDSDTVAAFDWNLNEECNKYNECGVLAQFVNAGKAVFQVEYVDEAMPPASFCPADNAANFDGLSKYLLLDARRTACR